MIRRKTINIVQIISIGDQIIASIDQNRIKNDTVLRDRVEQYERLKNVVQKTKMDNGQKEHQLIRELASAIREIEKRLDIIAPN